MVTKTKTKKYNDNVSAEDAGLTVWHNPTNNPAVIKICVGQSGNKMLFKEFIVPANGSKALSSEYDDAIRRERDGVITQGKCPWLLKNDETEFPHPNLHPCLNYIKVQEELEVDALAEELDKLSRQQKAKELIETRKSSK